MPHIVTASGVQIQYETLGSPTDSPILLIMGFGAQLTSWPLAFCAGLAEAGRYVIVFDNRDSGLSTRFDDHPIDLSWVVAKATSGDMEALRQAAPYSLGTMADDAFALLSAVGVEKAHVVGTSMGGMIAQTMAIEHPERVLSLTSMMSSTGEPEYGESTPEAMQALFAPTPSDRAGYIEAARNTLVWASRKHADLHAIEEQAAAAYDRAYYPHGVARHLLAMIVSGSRADGLQRLTTPTLVIHGLDDTLIAPSGGQRTAELVQGAELMLVPDMGHDRPIPLWPALWQAILTHTGDIAL